MSSADPQPKPLFFRSALVVDDHPLFCDALVMTLRAISRIETITTAASLGDALRRLEASPTADLIVLDLNLPDVDGFDGLLRLRHAARGKILVVSSMADTHTIDAAMRAGAAGFVPKHSPRDVFRRALEMLATGGTFLPADHVVSDTPDDSEQDALSKLASLTAQQARILDLICEGKLNKQIAFEVSIAETTVKAHVTAIMRKLGVHSRTQAVLIAKQVGFDSPLRGTAPPA